MAMTTCVGTSVCPFCTLKLYERTTTTDDVGAVGGKRAHAIYSRENRCYYRCVGLEVVVVGCFYLSLYTPYKKGVVDQAIESGLAVSAVLYCSVIVDVVYTHSNRS